MLSTMSSTTSPSSSDGDHTELKPMFDAPVADKDREDDDRGGPHGEREGLLKDNEYFYNEDFQEVDDDRHLWSKLCPWMLKWNWFRRLQYKRNGAKS